MNVRWWARAGVVATLVTLSACGGGGGDDSGTTGSAPATGPIASTADAAVTTLDTPTSFADVVAAANDTESAARALLVAEILPDATPEDTAVLDAAIHESLRGVVAGLAQPLGQSGRGRLPILEGTVMVGTGLGATFKFQNMSKDGRSVEEPSAGTKMTTTVEGSRLTVELAVSASQTIDGITITDDTTGKATADVCPDASGNVTIEIQLEERVSAGGVTARTSVTATATATVGDDAQVQSFDVEVRSGIDAQTPDGKNGFIEHESTLRLGADGWQRTATQVSRDRRGDYIRNGSEMRDKLEDMARLVAIMVLDGARDRWRNSFCVEVQAEVPARVQPGSATAIDVHVRQRFEGVELDAPVEVTLSGAESVEPPRIDKAPGTVTYTAPAEKDKLASLLFTSTSRRGIGKLAADVTTDVGSYHASGGADAFRGEGDICDLNEPFTISGGGVVMTFTPSSGAGGSYEYSGSLEGFSVEGSGTYRVTRTDSGGTLIASGEGSVDTPMGVMSAGGTETYTLTPIEACTP